MRLILFLVVCEFTWSYRPESQVELGRDEEICREVDASSFCNLILDDGDCVRLPVGGIRLRERSCHLQGPKEGLARVLPNEKDKETVTVRAVNAVVNISGAFQFYRVRLDAKQLQLHGARLSFRKTSILQKIIESTSSTPKTHTATTTTKPASRKSKFLKRGSRTSRWKPQVTKKRDKDGGALRADRGGMKLVDSTLEVFESEARYGGAIALSSQSQLSLVNSTIVTEQTFATAGGSIHAPNTRLAHNSHIVISHSVAASYGGGISALRLLVSKSNSSISIRNATANSYAGGVDAGRLVLHDSVLRISRARASGAACKGAAISVFVMIGQNTTVEIDDARSGENGACINAMKSLTLKGSSIVASGCHTGLKGSVAVGALLQLDNSTVEISNSTAKFGGGCLLAEKVRMTHSNLRCLRVVSEVGSEALEVANLRMTGSHLSLTGTANSSGNAVEMGRDAQKWKETRQPPTFKMFEGSSLHIADFHSGILSGFNNSLLVGNASFHRLKHYAVAAQEARLLSVIGANISDVDGVAFSCDGCRRMRLLEVSGQRLGALARGTGLRTWQLQRLQAGCRCDVPCVQLAMTATGLKEATHGATHGPRPWHLDMRLTAEDANLKEAPVLVDIEAPKVSGSSQELEVTCPPGSFSFVQESNGVQETLDSFDLLHLSKYERDRQEFLKLGFNDTCCASPRFFKRHAEFRSRNFTAPFYIFPAMNVTCDPAAYACVCTDPKCHQQIRRTATASTRVSCIACPMGQYSLLPSTRPLKGDHEGQINLPAGAGGSSCISCDNIARQVGKSLVCSGSTVQVPRGMMALEQDAGNLTFFRCPNALACPGGNMAAKSRACALGYEGSSPGCTTCMEGFGKKNTDPFVCKPCGRLFLGWAYFLLVPIVPVILAVRSAGETEKERMSMMIKVILSFGTFVANVQMVLQQTDIYDRFEHELKLTLGLIASEEVASDALLSTSFDCLLGAAGTRWDRLGFQAFHPALLLIIFALMELCAQKAFQASWVRCCIVLGNSFLPPVFAAFLEWTPCFHMQKREDGSFDSFSSYKTQESCNHVMGFSMPLLGSLLLLLGGPLYWAVLVSRSRDWPQRKEYIGFLIAGYSDHCEWWESTVLLRKALLTGAMVLLPVSYAPISLVIMTACIMLAALVGHLAIRPYKDSFMNVLEGSVLTYSMVALIMTLYLMSKNWTSTNKVVVFIVLVLSNAVTCIALLVVFLLVALRGTKEKSAEES
mmetsp:Transcript_106995/g.255385  ORF Transcript_106995/g.255385 Transcript_106995/m.255385 type:complete len:1231 (-) Transcript_106995:96-3788(-)